MKRVSNSKPAVVPAVPPRAKSPTIAERIVRAAKEFLDIQEPVGPTAAPTPEWVRELNAKFKKANGPQWPDDQRQLRFTEENDSGVEE